MRFSTSAVLATVPLLAAAQNPFEPYVAQFQNFLGSLGIKPPTAGAPSAAEHPVDAHETKSGPQKLEVLTLDNWKDTLYAPVKSATVPEEWWVLITGRNKTCFGKCLQTEAAFNETSAKFATLSKAPHVGYVNCENEPILCNIWSASPLTLWVFEMLPKPAPINIYMRRLNASTTTTQTFLDLYASKSKEEFKLNEGYFHPFDGPIAKSGFAVPLAYFFWAIGLVPSWLMMLIISFVSRSFMSRRMENSMNRGQGAAPAGGAPPGDARS